MDDTTTLRIERLFDAPPAEVFRIWTDRQAMEFWYRDGPDFAAQVTELEVRVGGRYRVEFGPAGQPSFVEFGEYLVVEPGRRLVMTETLEGVEAPWAGTLVTVEFLDQGGKTRLVLTHERFPSSHHRDLASSGWPGFLDRIDRLARL